MRKRPQARGSYRPSIDPFGAPVRRRSAIEEYAPMVFGGALLIASFAFAGHYMGQNADAHVAPRSVELAVAPASEVSTKGSLLTELNDDHGLDTLNTLVLEQHIVEQDGKTDFIIDDPQIEEIAQDLPVPKLKNNNAEILKKKLAEKTKVAKVKIEPAAVDLKAELKKPVKKITLGPKVLVPEQSTKTTKSAAAEKPMSKAEKQRSVAQRRIRAAEENCLARAVYFEARSESEMGQMAVAKVIINRTKQPNYPKTICGVVYQGTHRRNSCQFSFACDGLADEVRQPAAWAQSKRVAQRAMNGEKLPGLSSATNYHADYVKPKWSKSLKRLVKIGRHIFYAGG